MSSSRTGRFAAAIDFYFACTDAFAYDLAVCLNAWCFEADGSFNVTAARAFVARAMRRVRPLSAGRDATLCRSWPGARPCRFFLTRLQDWGPTPPEGALIKPHDPLEYERKLAVHRAAFGSGEGLAPFWAEAMTVPR